MKAAIQTDLSFAIFRPPAPVEWSARPVTLRPPTDGEIHLWKASLDREKDPASERACLSDDELTRADRFRDALHRDRFIRSRSILREVLGAYLQKDPGDLRFNYGPYGKPALADLPDQDHLHFNLSHTGGQFLLGVCHLDIGMDVEEVRDFADLIPVARRVFPSPIVAQLESLFPADRPATFFKLWTRQEAQLKANGLGLGFLTDIAASPPQMLACPVWSLEFSDSHSKYIAACALGRILCAPIS